MDKKYWEDLNKFPPLKKKDEIEIAKKAKNGDRNSYEKLINSNLRFVINVAKEYSNQGIDLEELVAYGNLGLCKAFKKFDPEIGNRFITYAVWWIRQSILQALSEHNYLIKIPPYQRVSNKVFLKTQEKLEQAYQREVSYNEIEEEILRNLKKPSLNTYRVISLEKSFTKEKNSPIKEALADDNSEDPEAECDHESFLLELKSILNDFSEREQIIIKKYHGIDTIRNLTLEEIGVEFGITRERVRQIKKKILKKLKHKSRKDRLEPYLNLLQPDILNDLSRKK